MRCNTESREQCNGFNSLYCSSLNIQRHTSKNDIFSPTWVVYTYNVTVWQTNLRMYILFYFFYYARSTRTLSNIFRLVLCLLFQFEIDSPCDLISAICVWYACSYSGLRRETVDQSNAVFWSKTGPTCNVSPRIVTFCVHFCFASGKIRLRGQEDLKPGDFWRFKEKVKQYLRLQLHAV